MRSASVGSKYEAHDTFEKTSNVFARILNRASLEYETLLTQKPHLDWADEGRWGF